MISFIHTIKVALERDKECVCVSAAEDAKGNLIRLGLTYWRGLDCTAYEILHTHNNEELENICHAGVWDVFELRLLLDELTFGETREHWRYDDGIKPARLKTSVASTQAGSMP